MELLCRAKLPPSACDVEDAGSRTRPSAVLMAQRLLWEALQMVKAMNVGGVVFQVLEKPQCPVGRANLRLL
jgi:hypothetical protein